ncbi:hypothetical protein A5675_21675 [Mycobacterium malmoense]|uniref:hypothetical protein n=1 Tax=Mycobacterium malmoense TaxID=1780 RepID=UPI00080B468C|nr:hypothetical protein [Mycobacterium malmoense]OCB33706.1 hypothetical protein A5675_21675 [Mycobacterium malmoense]
MSATATVKVAYPVTSRWWHRLFGWVELQVDYPSCGHIEFLLAKLLGELTTAEPSEPWAVKYRQDFHRSLRVGDMVVVGETAWAREESGWVRRTLQADEVVVVGGLTRMRQRQSQVNRWHGNWEAFTRADVAGVA